MTDSKLKIDKIGDKRWINSKGLYHRENGPAIIWNNKLSMFWFINDKQHRIDGPAAIHSNGRKYWRLNGILIREFSYD